jgi:hypothetical protein
MPKRWFLSPVVGTGSENDAYRSKIADFGVNHVAVIPSKPDGTPRFGWCLVKVNAASFAALDADADLDGFPLVSLDATVASLPAGVRTRLRTALERRGIDTTDVTGATPLRVIVRRLGRLLDDRFDEDANDVMG